MKLKEELICGHFCLAAQHHYRLVWTRGRAAWCRVVQQTPSIVL